MLRSLHIRNLVHIDSLDIAFGESLVIVSGPTGAGKSVMVGALSLLCGARADSSLLSQGAKDCVVEGEFSSDEHALRDLCEENDIEYDGGNFIIRRTVSAAGRSRAFINDSPVQLGVLSAFGAHLVDIHSQHDTLMLTSAQYQLSMLDRYAGLDDMRGECAAAYGRLQEARKAASSLQDKLEEARRMSDYNASVLEQLRAASIKPGELQALEQEQNALSHQEQVKELLSASAVLLESSSQEGQGINTALSLLCKNLEKLSAFLPSFGGLHSRLEEARLEIKDISEEVLGADSALDVSPQRLQFLDERIALLYSLMKRHGCSDEEQLVAKRDSLSQMVDGVQDMQDSLDGLRAKCVSAEEKLNALCTRLHDKRAAAAEGFAAAVLDKLSFQELPDARFRVEITPVEPSPAGADAVSFLFSAASDNLVPVSKCASGGELSRIMLSLKCLMSEYMSLPTMVFDEIDTGVSGSVADKMGSLICSMGSRMQIFAITHLPQVAAKGGEHFLVSKTVSDGAVRTTIEKLSAQQRVLEIARMLSGSSLTEQAVANARALLAQQ